MHREICSPGCCHSGDVYHGLHSCTNVSVVWHGACSIYLCTTLWNLKRCQNTNIFTSKLCKDTDIARMYDRHEKKKKKPLCCRWNTPQICQKKIGRLLIWMPQFLSRIQKYWTAVEIHKNCQWQFFQIREELSPWLGLPLLDVSVQRIFYKMGMHDLRLIRVRDLHILVLSPSF